MRSMAKFDASSAAAYLSKTMAAGSVHTISVAVMFPQISIDGAFGAFPPDPTLADVILLPDGSATQHAGFFPQYISADSKWGFWEDFTSDPANDTVEMHPGVTCVMTIEMYHTTGTSWTLIFEVNGVHLFTETRDFGPYDETVGIPILIGNTWSGGSWTDNILYIKSITVDGVLDDFSSGDFTAGGWTVTGDCTVLYDTDVHGVELTDGSFDILRGVFHDPAGYYFGNGFALEVDVIVPTDSVNALPSGAGTPGNRFSVLHVNADGPTDDQIYVGYPNSATDFEWASFNNLYVPSSPSAAVIVDQNLVQTLRYEATNISGTGSLTDTWDVVLKVDGVTIDSYTAEIGATGGSNLRADLGHIDSSSSSGLVYYVVGFRMYRTDGSVHFWEDFTLGSNWLYNWNSIFGSPTSKDFGPVARFDFSFDVSQAEQAVSPPGNEFVISCDIRWDPQIPSIDFGDNADPNTLCALQAITGFLNDADTIYPSINHPLQWEGASFAGGTPTLADWQSLEVHYAYISANNWTAVWKVDGVIIGTESSVNLVHDNTVTFPFGIGTTATGHGSHYAAYYRNVVVKDGSGTTLFSDDFTVGDFSLWDAFINPSYCSVVITSLNITSVAPPAAPTLVSNSIQLGERRIILTYDVTLDSGSVPATSDYVFILGGTTTPITSVSISANKVILTY